MLGLQETEMIWLELLTPNNDPGAVLKYYLYANFQLGGRCQSRPCCGLSLSTSCTLLLNHLHHPFLSYTTFMYTTSIIPSYTTSFNLLSTTTSTLSSTTTYSILSYILHHHLLPSLLPHQHLLYPLLHYAMQLT